MSPRNTANETVKVKYFEYLKHVDGKSDKTVALHETSILKFEQFTKFKCFKTFDQKQAIAFKEHLLESDLSISTVDSQVRHLNRFFVWLRMQRNYTRSIKLTNIQYLNLSDKDKRAAAAPADPRYPTLAMVERVVSSMPSETAIEKRDRALMAFTAITGIRDGATISLKLKHFDQRQKQILQNPREVNTKASKRIDTFFFPLSKFLETVFLYWVKYLEREMLFAPHDPIFPSTKLKLDANKMYAVDGLSKAHWKTAKSMRETFKRSFEAIGEDYYGPHSFRKMIMSEAYKMELSHAELKAWSQNLGHDGMLVTLNSYGKLSVEEQGRLVKQTRQQV